MRYAHGVLIGAVLAGIIFLGAMVIQIAKHGADAALLAALWNVYIVWFLISVALVTLPPLVVYFARRSMFREFIIYEAGSLGIFMPFWLILATDLSGTPFTSLFREGVTSAIIGFGDGGNIVGIGIGNILLVPLLALSAILGVIFLRPSFIAKYGTTGEMPELAALKESTEAPEEDSGPEMPGVEPPKASADTVASLRDLLVEIDTPEPTINLILNSGIATTTDLVGTSPEQLASLAGMDKRSAEALLIAAQKKLWFGDI
jgi:hypothetical protein